MPELLAPAGNERALVAAVQGGADAVYLGLREFSARRGAENFTIADLADATRYAHLRGARVYLAVNILILPDELDKALELAAAAREAGVDAFIVQDLGLAGLLGRHFPDVALHASTQMSTHTPDGVAVLAGLGFDRVTLARELTVAEVAECAAGSIPVEVFVHGALCYCYSGQCLLSSMVGGRSGNRGLCVQACRLAYELADDRLGPIEAGGAYPLSTRDLSAIDLIPDLARAGVAALKIEGRVKSAEYVATVVDVYRRAIDRYACDPAGYSVADEDRQALEEVFSRGFTQAYLAGIRDDRMMSVARPSDRGASIGRVVTCDKKAPSCDIKLTRDLSVGDEIEIWVRNGGRTGKKVDRILVDGEPREHASAGQVATIGLDRPVGAEDRVFRTANAGLLEAARRRFRPSEATRTVPVDIAAVLRIGEPFQLTAICDDGSEVRMRGEQVERARTSSLDETTVVGHLGRLGGTAYSARRIEVETAEGCFLPVSELNKARQRLVDELDAARLRPWRREPIAVSHEPSAAAPRKPRRPLLAAATDDRGTAGALAGAGLDWLYFDVSFDRDWESLDGELVAMSEAIRASGGRFALQLPVIAHEAELSEIDRLLDSLPSGALDGLVVGHVGQVKRFAGCAPSLIGASALNVTNAETAGVLRSLGVDRVGLSAEITGRQVEQIAGVTTAPLEVLVFGRLQVMIAEHCLYSVPGSCAGCTGRSGSVRDAKDFVFPVCVDRSCRSHIYNPFDASLVKQLPELAGAGLDAVRLELGGYSFQYATEVVTDVRNVLSLLPDEPETAAEIAEAMAGRLSEHARFTTGHYFRAVK